MPSDKTMDLANVRREYVKGTLDRGDLHEDPFEQFNHWYREAEKACRFHANSVILSTLDEELQPHSRTVLLKGLDHRGFVFFTNYESRKAAQIGINPKAAMTFFWEELERQVNIGGTMEKVSSEESDQYFATRPRGSQIGAWVSHQSQIIESRDQLQEKQVQLEQQFEGSKVPRPPHWGGYRLVPHRIEFWQGQASRLHDRFEYLKREKHWRISRLSP